MHEGDPGVNGDAEERFRVSYQRIGSSDGLSFSFFTTHFIPHTPSCPLSSPSNQDGQSMELSVVQQSREETEERVEELARKNQQLEQETIKQRHLLQLEKLKTEKVPGNGKLSPLWALSAGLPW